MTRPFSTLIILVGALLCAGTTASAQFIGTFSWQQQPFCNRLVLDVTQSGSIFLLNGYDDQCGAATRASVTGTAFPNPNGTIGIGITVVRTPGVAPDHIDATVTLPSANGTWRDEDGDSGTFAFGANTGGAARQTANRNIELTSFESFANLSLRRSRGTPEAHAPLAQNDNIGVFRVEGWNGSAFANAGYIYFQAAENWTTSSHGAHINFDAVPLGDAGVPVRRMTIRADGNVGIGVSLPQDRLDVEGDLRVGTTGDNGCVKNNNGGTIMGTCASDLRFKRDVVPYGSMLERVAHLRPVQFSWRAAEFADRGFGDAREDGLIAQEVEAVLPELVTTNEDGYRAVNYSKLPLLAIQAIKELKEKNDALERRLAALEGKLAARP